jgi:hypothetical protein
MEDLIRPFFLGGPAESTAGPPYDKALALLSPDTTRILSLEQPRRVGTAHQRIHQTA